MRLWPTSAKDKRIKELEGTVCNLVSKLFESVEDSTATIFCLRRTVDNLSSELVAAKALAVTRHKKIHDLKEIINQLKERGNDGKPTGRD